MRGLVPVSIPETGQHPGRHRNRAIHSLDHVSNTNLARWLGQAITAVRATSALNETGMFQRAQNMLQETKGDALPIRNGLGLNGSGPVRQCQVQDGHDAVFSFSREVHGLIPTAPIGKQGYEIYISVFIGLSRGWVKYKNSNRRFDFSLRHLIA